MPNSITVSFSEHWRHVFDETETVFWRIDQIFKSKKKREPTFSVSNYVVLFRVQMIFAQYGTLLVGTPNCSVK